jgi:hypothetical protein
MPERDHKLTVLLTKDEMETLQALAEAEGRTVSQTIRELIKAEARRTSKVR